MAIFAFGDEILNRQLFYFDPKFQGDFIITEFSVDPNIVIYVWDMNASLQDGARVQCLYGAVVVEA